MFGPEALWREEEEVRGRKGSGSGLRGATFGPRLFCGSSLLLGSASGHSHSKHSARESLLNAQGLASQYSLGYKIVILDESNQAHTSLSAR
jgi:hypothetical protein